MSTAKVSLIIPVYNTAKYLDECMKSVLEQTEKDIEILLVDDGSTDGVSPQMCDGYAERDSRVRVIHKENGGSISAWIRGTEEATSPYVCYLDSDDWVDTEMVESLYARTSLAEGKDSSFVESEIISSNYIVEKAGERRKEAHGQEPGEYTGKELSEIKKRLLGEERRPVIMSRCMKLISRQLFLDNIKYCNKNIKMGEDVNIMLPCLCDCKRLVILKDSFFYHYRLVFDSMSHGYSSGLLANIDLTDKTFRQILHDKGIITADKQMDREYVRLLFLVMKNELRYPDKDTSKRVRDIFWRKDIRERIDNTAVEVDSMANRLLYFCMKHPNTLTVGFTKAVLKAYDKKTN